MAAVKGFVFKSRFTPGLEHAEDVHLAKGDRITYRLLSGKTVMGTVKSEYSQQTEHLVYGYEVLFDDTGRLGFADEKRIVGWDGKP